MNRYNRSDKPDWVPPRSIKLLDQVRERVRYLHYSLQTEKAYVYWAKAFVLWAARSFGGFRHLNVAGVAGALRRVHDHDLHACAEGGCGRHGQPTGCDGICELNTRFANLGVRTAQGRNLPLASERSSHRPMIACNAQCAANAASVAWSGAP